MGSDLGQHNAAVTDLSVPNAPFFWGPRYIYTHK
jgi:hypothetical protein